MKQMETRRVLGVAIAMMVLLAVSAVPVMACPCEKGDKVVGNSGVGDMAELMGKEKSRILDMALESDRVKESQKQLVAEGFTQKDPEAFTVPVEVEDGLTTEVLFVAIPYENDKSEVKTVVYFHNPQTGGSITVLIDGTVEVLGGLSECVLALCACLLFATACGGACSTLIVPDPAEPIEVIACLRCIAGACVSCALAKCICTEYYCEERGVQWACDHMCP
ncbi:MAG: hypothetical protein U9N46_13125 [Euryarchaeota archaeon]|nr:hypothetical protein [Euryarchaeota archaeon]